MDRKPTPVSNWTKAVAAMMHCPSCHATNRPGAHFLDIEDDGRCYCNACGGLWVTTRRVPA